MENEPTFEDRYYAEQAKVARIATERDCYKHSAERLERTVKRLERQTANHMAWVRAVVAETMKQLAAAHKEG